MNDEQALAGDREPPEDQAGIDREVAVTGSVAPILDDAGDEQGDQVGQILSIGSWRGEQPPPIEQPDIVEDGTVAAAPEGIDQLIASAEPDPFEQRFGFNWQRAGEIAAGAELLVPGEDVEAFVEAFERSGLQGEQGFRDFVGLAKNAINEVERRRAEQGRLDDLEARLAETQATLPGSPYSALNAKLDSLLADKHQRQEAEAQVMQQQAWAAERIPIHSSAFEMVAQEAQRRGLSVPDMEAAALIGVQVMHLEPTMAAKISWLGAGGDPSVFGPRQDPRRAGRVVSSVVRDVLGDGGMVPSATNSATRPRSIDDLAAEAEDAPWRRSD